MTTTTTNVTTQAYGWFSRTEAWLDHKGKGAWIALMVLGFIFFWPVGLAILAYMIWSKRMFSHNKHHNHNSAGWGGCGRRHGQFRSTGNSAFDSYKDETLRRLEQEQQDFESFLGRLRDAKDKAEFDQFMDERSRVARAPQSDDDTPSDDAPKA
ncbi:DUF2852 domain-containing protein [Chachezhania antarctica]|uniref:DUF2852 domain-containing protein n=1 Tax=Chachezhania antarctica TaxID=2340860 RepID=UPI000EB2D1EE|nr:DUF2852 domain-containing protein [Chachezhania antarctica]|tara:strand:- start:539 stop:1000 length:462 start_codon:yes stop_codon:yes gene_type:complete